MESITYRISLDAHKGGRQRTLEGFFAGEVMARRIVISITGGSSGLDVGGDVTAVMYVTRPDGITSYNGCTVSNNTVIYDVLQEDVSLPGIAELNLKLMSGGKVLYAPYFALEVQGPRTSDLPATATPTYTALEEALMRAQQVYNKRLVSIELAENLLFKANYADGTFYESNAFVGAYDALVARLEGLGRDIGNVSETTEGLSQEIMRVSGENETLSNRLTETAEGLTREITRVSGDNETLSNRVTETAEGLTREITRVSGENETLSTMIEAIAGQLILKVSRDKIIQSINMSAEEGVVINATKVNLAGFLTLAMLADVENPLGWIFTKNPFGNNSNYLYGTNGAGNNAVLKTGGDVLLAGGLRDGYQPGDNTNGAAIQLFHDGLASLTRLRFLLNPNAVKNNSADPIFSRTLYFEDIAQLEIRWSEYQLLTDAAKMNGTTYFVPDHPDGAMIFKYGVKYTRGSGGGGGGNANIREMSYEDYCHLKPEKRRNGTAYFVKNSNEKNPPVIPPPSQVTGTYYAGEPYYDLPTIEEWSANAGFDYYDGYRRQVWRIGNSYILTVQLTNRSYYVSNPDDDANYGQITISPNSSMNSVKWCRYDVVSGKYTSGNDWFQEIVTKDSSDGMVSGVVDISDRWNANYIWLSLSKAYPSSTSWDDWEP